MAHSIISISIFITLLVSNAFASDESTASKSTQKRGLFNFGIPGASSIIEEPAWSQQNLNLGPAGPWAGGAGIIGLKHSRVLYQAGPSPAEVTAAVAAAKEATANVMIAQQQVQAAKDAVLVQQRIASAKESAAAAAVQKSEAAAAHQRSEASAAASAVVWAQQRVAEAKAAVSHHQRIAAAKEAQAAIAIQNSASAAAAEIQRTESEAAKLSAIHRSDAAAAVQHVTATKDATLGPLGAGHSSGPWASPATGPWNTLYVPIKPASYHPWG